MKIGINLDEVADYTSGCPFIDRVRMGRTPSAFAKDIPIGAWSLTTGLPSTAGQLTRAIPIDPASADNPHTYVLLCDENVVSVGTPWGIMKPVQGRATITIKSASSGVGLQITASGPVKKLAFMRAEHEQAYLDGEVLNPEYVARVAPFPVLRPLDWNATNYEPPAVFGSFPPNRPTLLDGYFTTDRGGIPAEYVAMLAKKTGAEVWYPLHHLMPDSMIVEIAGIFAKAGVRVRFEYSNEFGWTYHKAWAQAKALAAYGSNSDPNIMRWYGHRAGEVAKLVEAVSPSFQMELASQASNGASNLPYLLEGWDSTGAPRSMIAGYSNGSYLNLNSILPVLFDAMDRNDPEAFYAAVDGLRPALKGRHVKAVAACRAEKLLYKVYEAGIQLFLQRMNMPANYTPEEKLAWDARRVALLAWVLPLWHSERMADIEMAMIQDAFDAGAVEVNKFMLSGAGSQYGIWGTMPHVTQPVYPIYNRLLKALAPVAAVQKDDLPTIIGEMEALVARLSAFATR